MQKRQSEIDLKRKVVERLIDIIVFIGRQGLAYRATEESAADMYRTNINHGNFLELVLLLSKYGQILQNQVKKAIKDRMEEQNLV